MSQSMDPRLEKTPRLAKETIRLGSVWAAAEYYEPPAYRFARHLLGEAAALEPPTPAFSGLRSTN
jgi:hypothetical protein